MGNYPKQRNIDGYYFRVERNGKWGNACFTDLTPEERANVLEGRSAEWYRALAEGLADILRSVCDEFGIESAEE